MRDLSREEMRELDRRAIEEFRIPGIILMENAGMRAADSIASWMGEKGLRKAVVVCGKGNNGGDGYVVARHLHNRGIPVEVWRVGGDPQEGSDAATNLEIVIRMGIPMEVAPTPFPRERFGACLGPDVAAVDALLGTGLSGEVRDPYRSAIRALNGSPAHIFAIDCPSGLDCNTGEILGAAVAAERTVTFGAPKKGFSLSHGQQLVGRLIVVDISIPRAILEEAGGEG